MNKRKVCTIVLLVSISFSLGLYFTPHVNVLGGAVPAPELLSIDPFGFNFDFGTIITVNYTVPRFDGVDGVLLVGEGSDLSLDLDEALELNYSSSLKELSYYDGEFNLTENTKFKAYAWSGDISNGTYEELDVINHLYDYHYIYMDSSRSAPYLDEDKVNMDSIGPSTYFAELNFSVNLKYIVPNGLPTDKVTLALSPYRDRISNGSNTDYTGITFLDMDYESNSTDNNFPQFQITFNLTERTMYFCANNSEGWDIDTSTGDLEIYTIQNGFSYSSDEELNERYTDVDDINIIVTTVNETENDEFGVSYKVFKSASNLTTIVNWTDVSILDAPFNVYNETNNDGFNTTFREYSVGLGKFATDNYIYYQAYNLYFGERYNETNGNYHKISIYDSRPQLRLKPDENTYWGNETITFSYSVEIYRGNITGIIIDFGDGTTEDITSFETDDVYFEDTLEHIYPQEDAIYEYTIYANSTLNTNNLSSSLIVDLTAPEGEILDYTNTSSENPSTDGYVSLDFSYSDNYNISYIWIYWDDGTVWNATGDSSAWHKYTQSGTYNTTMQIVDKAGNDFNLSIIFEVELAIESETEPAPYAFTLSLLSIFTIGCAYSISKKRRKK